jgi:hypothetical protein
MSFLFRTYRQDYKTLVHVVILSKHHHPLLCSPYETLHGEQTGSFFDPLFCMAVNSI